MVAFSPGPADAVSVGAALNVVFKPFAKMLGNAANAVGQSFGLGEFVKKNQLHISLRGDLASAVASSTAYPGEGRLSRFWGHLVRDG